MKHLGKVALLVAILATAMTVSCNKESENNPGGNLDLNIENVLGDWQFDDSLSFPYPNQKVSFKKLDREGYVMTFGGLAHNPYLWEIDNGRIKAVAPIDDDEYARETVTFLVNNLNKEIVLIDHEDDDEKDTVIIITMQVDGSVVDTKLSQFDTMWTFSGLLYKL